MSRPGEPAEQTLATAFGPARLLSAGRPGRPAIVLVHGYAATADQWRPLMAALTDEFHLVAFDLIGFGAAPTPPPPYTLDRWVGQVEDVLHALNLRGGGAPIFLAGHSLGGLVAVEVARQHALRSDGAAMASSPASRAGASADLNSGMSASQLPTARDALPPVRAACASADGGRSVPVGGGGLRGLALISPFGILPPLMVQGTRGPARHLVNPLRSPEVSRLAFRALRASRSVLAWPFAASAFGRPLAVPPEAVAEWRWLIGRPGAEHALLDVIQRLEHLETGLAPGELELPTVLLWGRQDRLLPTSLAPAWRDRLPAAEVRLLDACGHLPHVERTAEVAAALRRLAAVGI